MVAVHSLWDQLCNHNLLSTALVGTHPILVCQSCNDGSHVSNRVSWGCVDLVGNCYGDLESGLPRNLYHAARNLQSGSIP